MNRRPYDPTKDSDAVHRIWRETGWIEDEGDRAGMDAFLSGAEVLVADVNGEAECLTASIMGDIRYQNETLPLGVIAAVTTSRVARKLGLAADLTAHLVASQALQGAAVSGLGMFEQGFYNQLGFGNGCYEHWFRFDPANLDVHVKARPPHRLTKDHVDEMHAAMCRRLRTHGDVNITPVEYLRGDILPDTKGFGLGYRDGENGELTHFFWCSVRDRRGPYEIMFMAYQTGAQFLELMALIRNFGDQVRTVAMSEPAHIQLQDLLIQPFKRRIISEKTPHATGSDAVAYWQIRILDLAACLAQTHLACADLRFNLTLSDPIDDYLDEESAWRGIGGEFVVTLGRNSHAEPGMAPGLPTLQASTGAFSRMWLGVRPASGLAITDELCAPQDLLVSLDQALVLPRPHISWEL